MNMFRRILFIQFLLTVAAAQFDWVDDGVPVRQGVHIEWQRSGDVSPNGDMIFSWSDTRNGIRDVFAQKVNSEGEKLWGSDGIAVVTSDGRQEDPILIADGEGGAFIIWADYKDEPDTEGDVYAQHVSSEGNLLWGVTGVALTNRSGQQTSLNMCRDGEGGVFAIWKDYQPSSYGHIYGTHISADGSIINQGEGIPIVAYDSYKGYASLEFSGTGSAVLVWQDERYGNGNGVWDEGEPYSDDNGNGVWDEGEWFEELNGVDLFSQRISNENGELLVHWGTTEDGGKQICSSLKDQINPRVTHFNEFNTIIVWEDNRTNGLNGNPKNDIYIQFLNEMGENLLSENGLPISVSPSWVKQLPRVKSDGTFAFVVWEDERTSPNWQYSSDIFGQKVDTNGSFSWTENGRQIVSYFRKQEQVRLTPDGTGGIYIGWEDERNSSTPEIEIYLQYIDPSENELTENGISICSAQYLQRAPLLKKDGSGGVYVLWEDQRTGSSAIYMQHLNSSQEISLELDGELQYYGIGTDGGGHSYSLGSLYLGQDENLLYWQDLRSGRRAYGQKISSDFGSEMLDNGTILCDDPTQSKTKVVKTNLNLFLGYLNDEAEQLASYQVLDMNLTPIDDGDGQLVDQSTDSQPSFDIVIGEDGYVYYIYSKWVDFWEYFTEIFIQKFDEDGNPQWGSPIQLTSSTAEDIVKSVHPRSGGGCVILYEFSSGGFTTLKSLTVDSDGQYTEPVDLTNESSINQFYEASVSSDNFIFVTWKDSRGNDYDIYGQFLSSQGNLLGNDEGIEIAGYISDQTNSTVALNTQGNEILVCWEDNQFNENADISCSKINVNDYSIGELINVAITDDEEMNPFAFSSESGTYLIAWENRVGGLDTEIFYQELNENNFVHEDNGLVVCDAPFDQMNPQIGLYSETENSYIIYWDDKRSTGKAELTNIFCQSVTLSSNEGMVISYIDDWNLVGLPLVVSDNLYTTVFPDAIPGTLYSFDGTYFQTQELNHGTGYWLRFNDSGSTTLTGDPINTLTVGLAADWNLISGITQSIDISEVDDPDGILVPGTLYGFSGTYEQVSTLEPGKGYWLRTTASGDIFISSSSRSMKVPFENRLLGANTLEINGMSLYFGKDISDEEKLSYSLPPKPPHGGFDARFSGGWIFPADSYIIEVAHSDQPLEIIYDIKAVHSNNTQWILRNLETNDEIELNGNDGMVRVNPSYTFRLEKTESKFPERFSLSQNFPNPFNPTTTIYYDVPTESFTRLTVYDISGKFVRELVSEYQSPGYHSIFWDGSDMLNRDVPSGIYFYSIEANNFQDVKKMLLVK